MVVNPQVGNVCSGYYEVYNDKQPSDSMTTDNLPIRYFMITLFKVSFAIGVV